MTLRGFLSLAFAAGLAVAVTSASGGKRWGQQGVTPPLKAVPYKASGIYGQTEKAGWTISVVDPSSNPSGKYTCVMKQDNGMVIRSSEFDLSSGKGMVEVSIGQPAMVYLELTPVGGGRKQVFGAAIAPRALEPVAPKPRDFDSFWKSKIRGLKAIPENAVLTPGESYSPDVDYATIQMDHVNGTHVYGQIAKPKTPGRHPAILVMQWASPPYPLQKSWVIELAKQGWLALNIEPHDVLPTAPAEYYRGLPQAIKNYNSIGWDDREKSYFVEMYLRDYRAVDYLTHRMDWDGKILVVTGTSMGGQQSLCVAGLHPKITHLIVEEPAGCDLLAGLHGRQEGYPFFPANNPKVMAAAPYVDPVNFASHIRATCLVAMGFVDNVAPPTGIWTAFNLIRGPKEAAQMPEAPHNNTATQEQQLPYYTRNSAWLNALVKGQQVEVRKNVGNP